MDKILIMDAKNYSPEYEEIYRVAVRGIIFIEGKLLMIEDASGVVKLPGGGIDGNETEEEALIPDSVLIVVNLWLTLLCGRMKNEM